MKEYIERELLLIGVDGCISALHVQAKGEPIQESAIKLVEATRKYIASLSAADVAEVVRCRECKRWDADPDSYGKDDGPKGKCLKTFEETYPDDFCSYGQRKKVAHD